MIPFRLETKFHSECLIFLSSPSLFVPPAPSLFLSLPLAPISLEERNKTDFKVLNMMGRGDAGGAGAAVVFSELGSWVKHDILYFSVMLTHLWLP